MKRARRRGQAMVEYSIINWVLIVALVLSANASLVPTPSGNKNLVAMMLDAYQTYLDTYYYVLSLPYP